MGGALTIVEDAMDGEEGDNHASELLVYEIGSTLVFFWKTD